MLYTGVTNDLIRRISEHRMQTGTGFAARYNVTKLIFYEATPNVEAAILREKQIKGGSRRKKLALVQTLNPSGRDLWDDIMPG